MSIKAVVYTAFHKQVWDSFITRSANAPFFFYRDYLSYHGDQLEDYSLMFFTDKGKLIAVIPSTRNDKIFHSHAGLSFGGFLFSNKVNSAQISNIWQSFIAHLKNQGFTKLLLKNIPFFYKSIQHDGMVFELIKEGATVNNLELSHCIDLSTVFSPNSTRRQLIKKNRDLLTISEQSDLYSFYNVLEKHIAEKYDSKPTHSYQDLMYLTSVFPDNIKLYSANFENKNVAFILIFVFDKVIKTQYICSTLKGYEFDAVANIIVFLHEKYSTSHQYLDLGTSNISPMNPNHKLTYYKESLGANPLGISTFELKLP